MPERALCRICSLPLSSLACCTGLMAYPNEMAAGQMAAAGVSECWQLVLAAGDFLLLVLGIALTWHLRVDSFCASGITLRVW